MEDRNKAIKEIVKAITGIFSSSIMGEGKADSPSNRTAYAAESIYEDHGELLEKNNEVMNSTEEILGDIYEDHGSTLEGILEELKKSNDTSEKMEPGSSEGKKSEEESEDTPSATLDESSDEPSVMDILYEAQGISSPDSSDSGSGGDSPVEVIQEGITDIAENTKEVADKKNPILEAAGEVTAMLANSFLPIVMGVTAVLGLIATFKDEIIGFLKDLWETLKGVLSKVPVIGKFFKTDQEKFEEEREADTQASIAEQDEKARAEGFENMAARNEAIRSGEYTPPDATSEDTAEDIAGEFEENDTTTASSLMPEASVSGPEQTSRSVATSQVEEAGQEINQPPVIVNNVSAPTNNNVVSGGESSSPTTAIVTARETHSSYMRFQQRRMNRVL